MDSEAQSQPLIAGRPPANAPEQSGRSTRAYKVAGLTLLACVLIAGQAMIAYFLLSQRSEIRSLEEQSDNLKHEMTRGRNSAFEAGRAAVPVRTHMSINAFPELIDASMDLDASGKAEEKSAPPATDCQLEAAGLKPVQVPGFYPRCDARGLYQAQQCFGGVCWCVNPATGEEIPGSMRSGAAICATAVATGRMSKVMPLPEISE